jgi:hypothetical protein
VQDIGLPGGAPELVVVPPSESHHQPPPQAQPEPRIGIGVLNGRGTGAAVPARARGGERQVAANEVPQLPVAGEVPVGEVGGAGAQPAPREDLTSSTYMASDPPATSPRLDNSRPDMTMTTESADEPVPEEAKSPDLSPTGRPGKPDPSTDDAESPAPKDDESGATETPPDPSTTVTPTSGKPCPDSVSAVTGSGEPADPAPAPPSGS